jgi:hypothetical protein
MRVEPAHKTLAEHTRNRPMKHNISALKAALLWATRRLTSVLRTGEAIVDLATIALAVYDATTSPAHIRAVTELILALTALWFWMRADRR